MSAQYRYKGLTTLNSYYFTNPPAIDPSGGPILKTTYNNETIVLVNNDGAIQRGTRGQAPPQDAYGPGYDPSIWESS